jgi:hypothetical protein
MWRFNIKSDYKIIHIVFAFCKIDPTITSGLRICTFIDLIDLFARLGEDRNVLREITTFIYFIDLFARLGDDRNVLREITL